MNKKKGKILYLKGGGSINLETLRSTGKTQLSPPKLRSNEWQRLSSIMNKIHWNKELEEEDKKDLQELQQIQDGHLQPYRPEILYLRTASAWHYEGRLCWIQDFDEGPLRELTPEEIKIWEVVGSWSLHGYVRPDGSIQPFVHSGWDRIKKAIAEKDKTEKE